MKCKQCYKRFQKSWKLAQHTKFEHPKPKLAKATNKFNLKQKQEGTVQTFGVEEIEITKRINQAFWDGRSKEQEKTQIIEASYHKLIRYLTQDHS